MGVWVASGNIETVHNRCKKKKDVDAASRNSHDGGRRTVFIYSYNSEYYIRRSQPGREQRLPLCARGHRSVPG
jgi:hypothetical protein